MKITVDLDVTPRAGQSQADAEAEMRELFAQYLTLPDNPFLSDYGPEAWGGYAGPFVTGARVTT